VQTDISQLADPVDETLLLTVASALRSATSEISWSLPRYQLNTYALLRDVAVHPYFSNSPCNCLIVCMYFFFSVINLFEPLRVLASYTRHAPVSAATEHKHATRLYKSYYDKRTFSGISAASPSDVSGSQCQKAPMKQTNS